MKHGKYDVDGGQTRESETIPDKFDLGRKRKIVPDLFGTHYEKNCKLKKLEDEEWYVNNE